MLKKWGLKENFSKGNLNQNSVASTPCRPCTGQVGFQTLVYGPALQQSLLHQPLKVTVHQVFACNPQKCWQKPFHLSSLPLKTGKWTLVWSNHAQCNTGKTIGYMELLVGLYNLWPEFCKVCFGTLWELHVNQVYEDWCNIVCVDSQPFNMHHVHLQGKDVHSRNLSPQGNCIRMLCKPSSRLPTGPASTRDLRHTKDQEPLQFRDFSIPNGGRTKTHASR